MKLRIPWRKDKDDQTGEPGAAPGACTHPRVDVEMHGTAIKRRWCIVCGADLPLPDRSG
jgi:hypothetical protein